MCDVSPQRVTTRHAPANLGRWGVVSVALCLLALVGEARADLYTIEKNGEIFITSRPIQGGRVLYHVREAESRRRAPRRTTRAGTPPRWGTTPSSEAARAGRYAEAVSGAAEHYGLPVALVWAVMKVESNFYPHVVSDAGAQGLMQLMPGTATEMGVTDPFEPVQNIYGGARYLRILANKFNGDLVLTLSAYHAGGGAVSSAGGIPYTRTAEYVRRVLNAYYAYQKTPPVSPESADGGELDTPATP